MQKQNNHREEVIRTIFKETRHIHIYAEGKTCWIRPVCRGVLASF